MLTRCSLISTWRRPAVITSYFQVGWMMALFRIVCWWSSSSYGGRPLALQLFRCSSHIPKQFKLASVKHSLLAIKRSISVFRGWFWRWSWTARVGFLPASLAVPGAVAFCRTLHTVVLCKSRRSRDHAPFSRHVLSADSDCGLKWSQLWCFVKADVMWLILAVASAMLAAVLNTLIPLRLGELVNTVSNLQSGMSLNSYTSLLLPTAISLVALYVAQSVCTFGYISILSFVGERLATRLRSSLFHSLLQQDMSFFDEHRTGELISRLSSDVQDLKSSFKLVISQGLRSVTQGVGCVVSLYIISPQMTAAVSLVLPAMIFVGTVFGSVLRRWSRNAQEQVAIATGVADEAIGNMRTVRAFAMEDSEHRLYYERLSQSEWASVKLGYGVALFQALSNLAINGVVIGVVCHGGLLLSSSKLTSGDLMAFLVATQTIQRSLGTLSVLFGQVVRAISAGGRVMQFMNITPSISLHGGSRIDQMAIKGSVVFKSVTFSYPSRSDQAVLSDLSLTLPAGKVTALCGLSGAGKSTIAALLERFYEPVSGHIELDGHLLNELDPSWLRKDVIGYINQEPVLFATTVMENIRYGCPSASDNDVIAAAKLANAHDFIQRFPHGYSTMVGERGMALSGGQKQRVAIARALLKNPQILILDEATSALDAHSEKLVQEALEKACQGRTVLVIAHRLSTIREADQIAVLHHGKLRQVGSHAQLVANKGLYSELIRRQTAIN